MKRASRLLAIVATVSALGLAGCQDTGTKTASASAAKPYPLDVCIVSGEKLGSMGEAITHVHEGQEVKFCCKNCKPDFVKEPAKFMSKLAPKK